MDTVLGSRLKIDLKGPQLYTSGAHRRHWIWFNTAIINDSNQPFRLDFELRLWKLPALQRGAHKRRSQVEGAAGQSCCRAEHSTRSPLLFHCMSRLRQASFVLSCSQIEGSQPHG